MSTVILGDLCDFINGGAWSDKEFVANGLPVLKVTNCKSSGFELEEISYLSISYAEKFQKNKLNIKDVIIMTVGSHPNLKDSAAGRVAIVTPQVENYYLNQNAVCVRSKDESVLNQNYLGLLAKSRLFQHFIQTRGRGAANQMRIAISSIKEFKFDLPPLEKQQKIANILSAYDDLIENNKKQIKLLEEAAQRLYKEWFVDLRFPGHKNTKIVDGVSVGWERKRLVDIANIQYGLAFDGTLFNKEKGMPIIRIRNIPEAKTDDFTTETADEQYIVHNGEILVGMDGEFHINSWVGKDAYLVQRTCCIRPKQPELNGWLLWAIHEPIKFFEKTVTGATVAHLGKKHLDTIELLVPPLEFYLPFQTLFEKRLLLLNQNHTLSEARDRLLPKLMSGEIEV